MRRIYAAASARLSVDDEFVAVCKQQQAACRSGVHHRSLYDLGGDVLNESLPGNRVGRARDGGDIDQSLGLARIHRGHRSGRRAFVPFDANDFGVTSLEVVDPRERTPMGIGIPRLE